MSKDLTIEHLTTAKEKKDGRKRAGKWGAYWAPFVLVFLPAFVMAGLVKKYAINAPFLDDLMAASLFEKYHAGILTWHDMFSADMEHRIAWLRAVMVVFHKCLPGHYFIAQVWFTWLLLGLTLVNIIALLRQTGFKPVYRAWPVALLASLTLYSPVHYEMLLWPILHQVAGLAFFLSSGVVIWLTSWSLWWRFLLATLCCLCAMFSMASGIFIWMILALLIAFCAPIKNRQGRIVALVLWVVLFGIVTFLYFHDLKNEMEPEFSPFAQGIEDTMHHHFYEFFYDPWKSFCFVARLLGSSLMRGNSMDLMTSTLPVGIFLLVCYAFSVGWAGYRFRNRNLRHNLLPWLGLGAYSLAAAMAIALGRGWVGTTGAYALSSRYMIHSVPLCLALPPIAILVSGDLADFIPSWRLKIAQTLVAGWALMLGILIVRWGYGEQMMSLWSSARMRSATNMMFYKTSCGLEYDYPSTPKQAIVADNIGLLNPPMLKNARLDNFKDNPSPLNPAFSALTSLRLQRDGKTTFGVVEGHAVLKKSGRVPDGIFLTYQDSSDGHLEIFYVTQITAMPLFLTDMFARDLDFVFPPQPTLMQSLTTFTARFDINKLPSHSCRISAWAYDYPTRRVTLLPGIFEMNPLANTVKALGQGPDVSASVLPIKKK